MTPRIRYGAIRTSAMLLGLLIACVDAQPGWDDTGVTAAAVAITAGLYGLLAGRHPWYWGLAIGIWIPLWGMVSGGNTSSILALVIACVSSYVGWAIRKVLVA